MGTWRGRWGLAALAAVLGSMVAPSARSQPAPAAAPTAPDPAAAEPAEPGVSDTSEASEDEEADLGEVDPGLSSSSLPVDARQRAAWLSNRLSAAASTTAARLPGAKIGISIVDMTTGEVLFERDPGGAYNLASVTKVMTSAAALTRLGPEFRWRTAALADVFDPVQGMVGTLYLRGRGDPTLGTTDLDDLARALRRRGVKQIRGGVVFDASYFDNAVEPPRFEAQPLERAAFRAPIGAFAVQGNAFEIVVEPDPAGIDLAAIRIEPPAPGYIVVAEAAVATVNRGRTRIRATSTPVAGQIKVTVTGQIRFDHGQWRLRRRVDDPIRFASELFRASLAAQGIRLGATTVRRGPVPPTAITLAEHESEPLAVVIRDMNKLSNNFTAETVLKTLGAEVRAAGAPASWRDGLAEVEAWLIETGAAKGSFRVSNGSGLFDASAMTPRQVTGALVHAYRDFRVGPDFVASLAIAGVDGTLRRRLGGSARGRARAKTGTLDNTVTIAGFIGISSQRPIAFAVLVNDVPKPRRGQARVLGDAVIGACAAFLEHQ